MTDARVSLEEGATRAEVDAVSDAFAEAGLTAEVTASYARRGAGVLPWVIHTTLDGAASFMIGKAAELGWGKFKMLCRSLWEARKRSSLPPGEVVFDFSEDPRVYVIIPANLPDKAYVELFTKPLPNPDDGSGCIVWDDERQKWSDTWDTA